MAPWWQHPGALALLAANLMPLAGVMFFGWSTFALLVLFWLDNVVIGLYLIVRMRLLRPFRASRPGDGTVEWQVTNAQGAIFGYFFFTVIQGFFVIAIFGSLELKPLNQLRWLNRQSSLSVPEYLVELLQMPETGVAVLAMIVSRGVDLYADYRQRQEFADVKANEWKMGMVFERIVVTQVVILAGGFAAAKLGAPAAALVLLIALKTGCDLYAHGRGRSMGKSPHGPNR